MPLLKSSPDIIGASLIAIGNNFSLSHHEPVVHILPCSHMVLKVYLAQHSTQVKSVPVLNFVN